MNNDLISREALKKALREAHINMELTFGIASYGRVMEIIDNAPTVEPEKALIANVTFDEDKLKEIVQTEVIDKIKSGELVLKDERPQGEWKRHDEWRNGEYIGGFYHVNCPCEDGYYSKWETNFCPNCGADMRGGETDASN